jgi:two-component system, OmpR family, sensor histidine kinase MprB
VTLRNRISVAAAAGVLIVVSAVSVVLYLSYDASLRSRVDPALVDAAQQANTVAQRIKQSAGSTGATPDVSTPVTIGSVDIQLLPGPLGIGQPTRFGPLTEHDLAVSTGAEAAYFADIRDGGKRYRVYTAAMPNTPNGGALVRTSRAADADDAALRTAALLLLALTVAATAVTYAAARLTASRILRPIGDLTAAAEHVTQTRDLSARLRNGGADEVGRLSTAFDTMLGALSESVTAQRQLVADASHELRTPLTTC